MRRADEGGRRRREPAKLAQKPAAAPGAVDRCEVGAGHVDEGARLEGAELRSERGERRGRAACLGVGLGLGLGSGLGLGLGLGLGYVGVITR